MRRKHPPYRSALLTRIEKNIIRVMIAGTVLLTLFQLRLVTDPVDFYLKIAGDIDTPAFKYSQYAKSDSMINLHFYTEPVSPVQVKQNGQLLGVIGKGTEIKVEQGTVELDASEISYPVSVTIIYNEKKYTVHLDGDSRSFEVKLKENGSL